MLIKNPVTIYIKNLSKPSLEKASKRFNTVDITSRDGKFTLSMMNLVTCVKASIYKSTLASSAIGMNNTFGTNFNPTSMLKRLFARDWNNLFTDFSFSLRDSKDDRFTRCSPDAFAGNSQWSKDCIA